MLNNRQIADKFNLLGEIMELHDENPFKIRSYYNAYQTLRKWDTDLTQMTKEEILKIPRVGKAIGDKIEELITTGRMNTLTKYEDKTPEGVIEMLSIRGLGPKKIRVIWHDMKIETVGELLYACEENRLVNYKGFGEKTQSDIKQKIEYYLKSKDKFLYAKVHQPAERSIKILKDHFPDHLFSLCGDIRRLNPVVTGIEIITNKPILLEKDHIEGFETHEGKLTFEEFPVKIYEVDTIDFYKELFKRSGSEDFISAFSPKYLNAGDENDIFKAKGVPFIPPEFREAQKALTRVKDGDFRLIAVSDIKGIVHNHSTYSDGIHTLKQMSDYVKECGFEYFVISDHSQSAGYAGGLKEEEIYAQWQEIDHLNREYGDSFHVYKSIESDILTDGSLDYPDDILSQFDLVIASVHSVLNMDEDRATSRLIKSIENPYTKILGHPTGRLLLARPGYPINHQKIIDACAANGVTIELNANPLRLDLDWTWIEKAVEKGVLISINPDAHSMESIHLIKYGVAVARKAGLNAHQCLSCKTKVEFDRWLYS